MAISYVLKFMEKERLLRLAARTGEDKKGDSSRPETTSDMDDKVAEALQRARTESAQAQPKTSAIASSKVGSGKLMSKPAWAMTKDVAENEDRDLDDAEGLLDFARDLDFDKYISDIEVKSMMDKLQKRIKELEKEIDSDDKRGMDAEIRAAKREMMMMMGDAADLLTDTEADEKDNERATLQVARAVLQGDAEMQAVHSMKSVSAMLKTVAAGGKEKLRLAGLDGGGKEEESKVANMPRIVTHEPSNGARLDGKNKISNLPYMHRNPSI